MVSKELVTRIRAELHEAGVTRYGLGKFNSRYLPRVIHESEHIMGVVYGRVREGVGFLSWTDRMLIASDQRVISLTHRPGYTYLEEFAYDVISGVIVSKAGPFSALILRTAAQDIALRFVNVTCAARFTNYIETRIGRRFT